MTWYDIAMRPAALVCLALLACAVRPDVRPQPTSAPRETASTAPAPPLVVEPDPPQAVATDPPARAYESIERRAEIREVLSHPVMAKWRGIYRGGGGVRLRPDGPVTDADSDASTEIAYDVFEMRNEGVHILVAHSGVTLLAWVDSADFVPQPQQQVVLASAPNRPPAAGVGRIEIAPGEQVRVLSTRDDWHEVELSRRGLRGWLPVAVFAPVFPKGGFPVRTHAFAGTARRRTRVLDRRGGKTIWRLSADAETEVEIVQETKGWLEIVMVLPCDATFRVTGFVRTSDVHDISERGGGGFGCGHIGVGMSRKPAADAIDVRLPDGTELFDDLGQLVGVVRRDNVLRQTPDGTLHVPSRWGPIPVVAEVEATPLPTP